MEQTWKTFLPKTYLIFPLCKNDTTNDYIYNFHILYLNSMQEETPSLLVPENNKENSK